jgi:hypothetical protein
MALLLISDDTWFTAIIPALGEQGPRAMAMLLCTCKGRFTPPMAVAAVKAAFPLIKDWPDRSKDRDGGAKALMDMAKHYFTTPSPLGAASVAVDLTWEYVAYGYNVPLDKYFLNAFRHPRSRPETRLLFPALMGCDAGRRTILEVVNETVAEGRMQEDVARAITTIVRNGFEVSEQLDGRLCIIASAP